MKGNSEELMKLQCLNMSRVCDITDDCATPLKLMTDSGGQIKLKYTLYMKFPRGFVCAKFLGKFFATICHVGAAARAQFSVSHVGHHPDRSRPNQIMPG